MTWRVEVGPRAARALRKLDRTTAARIVAYLDDTVAGDPRTRGKALVGELGGFWRYRVGDWRVICRIEDARLVVLVIEVGIGGRFIGEGVGCVAAKPRRRTRLLAAPADLGLSLDLAPLNR